MKVIIDRDSGFCFGVVRAIKIAEDTLKKDGELFCLGQIVHNEEEIGRLEKLGLKTIQLKDLEEIRDSKVLLRAHGEPPETYKLLEKNNNLIIDATCPIVLKLQEKIKRASELGEKVFIYGRKDHPEVIGLRGQCKEGVYVFDDLKEIENFDIPKNISLFSQTTKDPGKYLFFKEYLTEKGINVSFHNSICGKVANRKKELKTFCSEHQLILFVAGKKSSNGKVLFEYCKSVNGNTQFISSASEIDKDWFRNSESVGICGATSTPAWLMDKIKEEVQKIEGASHPG